jgi:carbon storage regulator
MFVIRRKIGQSIRIGEQIVVEVLDATPNRVKLGVHAPAEVRVVRAEVLIAEMQNREAAGSASLDALAGLAQRLRTVSAEASSSQEAAPAGDESTARGPGYRAGQS